MKVAPLSSEAFNLVTVGSWNPAIFSPEWAKQHLADNKEQDVVLAIPMHLPMGVPRLTVDSINICPSPQSLVMDCVQYSDENIDVCVARLHKIVSLLPHTPTSGIGINFRFVGSSAENEQIAELFAFSDAAKINAEIYNLSSSLIRRSYALSDASTMNLTIDSTGDKLRFEFNFHSDVRKLSDVAEKTNTERIHKLHDQAIKFLSDVYQLELET